VSRGPRFELGVAVVRPWELDDLEPLVRHADDPGVAAWLRDGFPHPYGRADGERFLARVVAEDPVTSFAIEVEGEAAGGIGFTLQADVERVSAELGYWLARPHWGKGITTAAVRAATEHALAAHGLVRVYATPYDGNAASCRVLEKAGFVLEARLRRAVIKGGVIRDKLLYAYVVDGP